RGFTFEATKFGEGAVEVAEFGVGGAAEFDEGIAGERGLGGGKGGGVPIELLLAEIVGRERLPFRLPMACALPERFGDDVDTGTWGGRGGLMFIEEAVTELVERGGVFARENDGFGVEAELEGVPAGLLLTGFRTGTGGVLGVATVGVDL